MANDPAHVLDQHSALKPTREIAEWVAGYGSADVTASARTWAIHAFLDWIGVTVAGAREPLTGILADEYAGDSGPCTVIAFGRRASAHDAALINGSGGHALDYDDVNYQMHGHPTAPVAPVVLALGEKLGKSPAEMLRAFIAGYEVECAIGGMAGDEHYDNGFHVTGTMGAFGAAAAAANLLGLDTDKCMKALGIAASQAAGLKANFGTMTKPLHAGKAAMNGMIAAQLAARGFTAADDLIECPQGFMAATAPGFVPQPFAPGAGKRMAVEKTLFKYHAACYLTHSTIEAVQSIRNTHGIGLEDLAKLTIFMPPANRKVCDIPDPESGLEIKFSIRHLAAMALDGENTADLDMFTDANAQAERYGRARAKIMIEHRTLSQRCAGAVSLETIDGRTMVAETDVGIPATDTGAQWQKLSHKARTIMTPAIGAGRTEAVIAAVGDLGDAETLEPLLASLT